MNWAVQEPLVLLGGVFALLPLFNSGLKMADSPWLALLPKDVVSLWTTLVLRLVAMLAIIALVLGMAGLYQTEQTRVRIGRGAHIVLLLDRSSSMDNTFAGHTATGQDESKAIVAKRLLTEFVAARPHDLIGVAGYSTAPLFITPLTENHTAVQAAIAATATPALSYTHVSKGLGMALNFFEQQALTGSRIIVLVSDGAATLNAEDELKLRQWFKERQVRLYWIFLRTAGSPGIFDHPQDARDDNPQAMPERFLHQFFTSLETPYQAFEAESPQALQKAIKEVNRLENLPLEYIEHIPKVDWSNACYLLAGFCIALLFSAQLIEWSP